MRRKKPLVSVVMPVYNAERYLARAIESILSQTFKDFELLIVNDASTDNSSVIIKKYAKKDPRIRVVNNQKNLRIAMSLNKAVYLSEADIIARMDADDISHPRRLELQYNLIKRNPKIGVVGANMVVIDKNGKQISKREYPVTSKELKKVVFRYSPFAHPVVVFRKIIFEEFEGYDKKMVPCEDIDLWFKIGSKYEFATVPKFLLWYTLNPTAGGRKKLRNLELLGFRIKINAMKKYGYRPSLYDLIYNFGEFSTLWFMPTRARVWLYNFLRSRRLI